MLHRVSKLFATDPWVVILQVVKPKAHEESEEDEEDDKRVEDSDSSDGAELELPDVPTNDPFVSLVSQQLNNLRQSPSLD